MTPYNASQELMPTILSVQGWRFGFYSNEGNEPMHVHAEKGDAECKYWLHPDALDIDEEFEYKLYAAFETRLVTMLLCNEKMI
jgi:hypothetical protein